MSRLLTERETEDYKTIIENYQPSAKIIYNFARSRFAVIAGPTGVGKDTIRSALMKNSSDYISILSTTTRPRRPGEHDGEEYHFRDLKFINQGLEEQRFLQIQAVHKQQLSCLDSIDVEKLNDQQIGLSILAVQAEVKLRELNRDLKTIFVVTPSLQVLVERMKKDREMTAEETNRRIIGAKEELKIALSQSDYYFVLNDKLEDAVELCNKFLRTGERNVKAEKSARIAAENILKELLDING